MSGAELAARVTSARAVLSDFQRETGDSHDVGWRDWHVWALRLAQHLQFLLEVTSQPAGPRIDGSVAATYARPDGSASLSPDDLMTALGALSDAAEYRANSLGSQPRDRELAVRYRALAYRLGDDRV